MLDSMLDRAAALPRISTEGLFSVAALGSFAGLLLQDKIHPVVILLLEVYLTF